jgi:hypothetical protein
LEGYHGKGFLAAGVIQIRDEKESRFTPDARSTGKSPNTVSRGFESRFVQPDRRCKPAAIMIVWRFSMR